MKGLVDTSVWSLVLWRQASFGNEEIKASLASLLLDGRAAMIGAVRQELLSGIKDPSQLARLICAIIAAILPITLYQPGG